MEHNDPGIVDDLDVGVVEGDCASGVTELSHAEKVVGEGVHDETLVGAWWEVLEW
jgi:hypothetical protein